MLRPALERRKGINAVYSSRLPPHVRLPDGYHDWRFNIRVENRRATLDAIFESGLFASSHYASLAGIMGEGEGSHAEVLANEVVNLFNDDRFDLEKAERICDVIVEKLAARY